MTIKELIHILKKFEEKHGDIEVFLLKVSANKDDNSVDILCAHQIILVQYFERICEEIKTELRIGW